MERTCRGVIACIKEDHESLKNVLAHLQDDTISIERKKAMFHRFLPLFHSHMSAEELVLLGEGLQIEKIRHLILQALEEHELLEIQLQRMELAADEEQWLARLRVFCGVLERHLEFERNNSLAQIEASLPQNFSEELGRRYLEARNNHELGGILSLSHRPQVKILQAS